MEKHTFTVDDHHNGVRVDKFIALELGDSYSRTYVKYLMDNGFVKVNGKDVKPRYAVAIGDEITAEVPPQEPSEIIPENIPIDVLYEDESIIVVNKSAGMVVHPGAGNKTGTLVSALLYRCGELPGLDDNFRPGIVHRLDKDTSGVIVVAKNDRALRSLSKQFQNRTVKKCYVALVRGRIEMDNGIIDVPIARNATDRKKMAIEHETGKEARTIYHVVRRFKDFTFLRVDLETGRTHQIRVHMKHFGHPVLGDLTYGGPARDISRQALHAETLKFTHPDTGKTVEFTAPIPEDIKNCVEKADKA